MAILLLTVEFAKRNQKFCWSKYLITVMKAIANQPYDDELHYIQCES